MPHWHFVDVDDGRIPTARNTAVRLDRTEYRPAMLAIARISRETERDKQRLECFRPVVLCTVSARRTWEKKRASRTGACIVRHTVGTARRCDLISKKPTWVQKTIPSSLDVPIARSPIQLILHFVARNPKVCNLRRESSAQRVQIKNEKRPI